MPAHHHTEAAAMIGVSTATLRRLARSYEAAFGELPTDGAGGRIYPDQAINRMSEARDLVASRRVGSLTEAFKQLANGDLAPLEPSVDVRDEMLELLRRIDARLEALESENRQLRERLEALPPPEPQAAEPPSRPWWKLWARG
jgi:hypothetical protein